LNLAAYPTAYSAFADPLSGFKYPPRKRSNGKREERNGKGEGEKKEGRERWRNLL